jgi:hypothetical protein
MINSKKIHREKKKIDKLAEFSKKVNRFINTKLVNKDNSKLLDIIDKINDRLTNDKKYLKNLEYKGSITNQNPILFNSPFMPGQTMAFDGKRSVPVANPLGTAGLMMAANDQASAQTLSLTLSATDPLDAQAKRIINNGPNTGDIPVYGMMPSVINSKGVIEPSILSPQPKLGHKRSLEPPIHLTEHVQPMMVGAPLVPESMKLNRFGFSLGGLGTMPTAELPISITPGMAPMGMAPGMAPMGMAPMGMAPGMAPMGMAPVGMAPMRVSTPMTSMPVTSVPLSVV